MRESADPVHMWTHANRSIYRVAAVNYIGDDCCLNAHGTCHTDFLRHTNIERQSDSFTDRYSHIKPRLNSRYYTIDNTKSHTDSHCHAVNDANNHVDRNAEHYGYTHSDAAPSSWCSHLAQCRRSDSVQLVLLRSAHTEPREA